MSNQPKNTHIPSIFLATWALTCFITLMGFPTPSFLAPYIDTKNLEFYSLIICSVLVYFIFSNRAQKAKINILDFSWFIFLLYSFLNPIITNASRTESFAQTSKILLILLFIKFYSNFKKTFQTRLLAITAIIGAGSIAISIAINYNNFINIISFYDFFPIGHISHLSDFTFFLCPLLGYLILDSKNFKIKIFYSLILIATLTALSFIIRQSTFLAFSFSVLLFLIIALTDFKSYKPLIFKYLPTVLIVFITATLVSNHVLTTESQFKKPLIQRWANCFPLVTIKDCQPGSKKIDLHQKTITGIKRNPIFGWGYGNFEFTTPSFDPKAVQSLQVSNKKRAWINHPHNEFLYQLFEGGIVGTVLVFLCLGVFLFFAFSKLFKISHSSKIKFTLLIVGFCSILICFSLNSSSNNPVIRLIFMVYALKILSTFKDDLPYVDIDLKNTKIRLCATLTTLLLIFTTAYCAIGYHLSSYYIVQATVTPDRIQRQKIRNKSLLLAPERYDILFYNAAFEINARNYTKAKEHLLKIKELFPTISRTYQTLDQVNQLIKTSNQK